MDDGTRVPDSGPWDHLVGELHALRRAAGDPSYAEIARRITEQRTEQGLPEHASRIARSSVHDAFRLGRTRVNLPLVREIAAALGADPGAVEGWINPSLRPDPTPEPVAAPSQRQVALLMVGCLGLNLIGRVVVDTLHLPVYFDMVGTAVVAIVVGPWRGALVGGATNLIGVVGALVSLPFALVNIVGALVWGYGIRRLGLGRTLPRFFALNLLVALSCSLIAVPILMIQGGSVDQGQDLITQTFAELTDEMWVAVGLSNLVTSTADKVITGFVALVIISALPLTLRSRVDLVLTDD